MKKILQSAIVASAILMLNGCGGASSPKKKTVTKDVDYYTHRLKSLTSLDSLHTPQRVLFTIGSLDEVLKNEIHDINNTQIEEIIFQLHRNLERGVKNVNNYTFTKDTPIIMNKFTENNAKGKKSKALQKPKLLALLDRSSQKIIGRDISGKLPNNFLDMLDRKQVDKNIASFISVAPDIPKDIACPPDGKCEKYSPIKKWQNGGLADVSKIQKQYKIEVEHKLEHNSITKAMLQESEVLESKSWTCKSDGYTITAVNYKNGSSQLQFMGSTWRYIKARDWTSYQPYELQETHILFTAPNSNLQHEVCLTDGSWISSGENYYAIQKFNNNPWSGTSAHWDGGSALAGLEDIENAAQALAQFNSKLASHANGPLPNGCSDIACPSGGHPVGSYESPDPMGRITMTDLDMAFPGLSGQDLIELFRGSVLGYNQFDPTGLSENWIKVLQNLGYTNANEIRQNVLNQTTNSDGTFRFIKLESSFDGEAAMRKLIESIPPDYNTLIILPKTNYTNGNNPSYPTNLYYNDIPPVNLPISHLPNPNYCPQIDPYSNSYIPLYLTDPKVVLELATDVLYLTEDQLDRLEQEKKLRIYWDGYFDKIAQAPGAMSESFGYGSLPNVSYPPRKEYNCHQGETPKDPNLTPTIECDTKDEAYYDALIDRLIIVNPLLNGNINNHPCLSSPNPWFSSDYSSF